jgi:hypothetical protein
MLNILYLVAAFAGKFILCPIEPVPMFASFYA